MHDLLWDIGYFLGTTLAVVIPVGFILLVGYFLYRIVRKI